MQQISGIAKKVPGVGHVVTVSGASILDNMASLANAGVAFVVLDDWDVRLKQNGQDLRSITLNLNRSLHAITQAVAFALPRPRSRASATSAASRCKSRSGMAILTTRCCRA